MPDFNKGKKQLSGRAVECLQHITHVCLHVEWVIGMLCQMYMLLGGAIPITVIRGGWHKSGQDRDSMHNTVQHVSWDCLGKVEHEAMQPCHDAM